MPAAAASLPPSDTPTPGPADSTPLPLDRAAKPTGRIVFRRFHDGEGGLYAVEADESRPREAIRISDDGWNPTWSPDGKRIAFVRTRDVSITAVPTGGRRTGTPREIWLMVEDLIMVDADGSNPVNLTNFPDGNGDRISSFAWSPDGRWIGAAHITSQPWQNGSVTSSVAVRAIATDGSGMVKEFFDPGIISPQLVWFPDGRHLAYTDPHGMLSIVSLDTGEVVPVMPMPFPPMCSNEGLFDISADGRFLVYVEQSSEGYSIRRVDLDSWRPGTGPKADVLFSESFAPSAAWNPGVCMLSLSPDGMRLLYVHSERRASMLRLFTFGGGAPVAVATLFREAPEKVNGCICWECRPGWSPDGQWIVYAALKEPCVKAAGDVFILNVAQAVSGVPRPVWQASYGSSPDWQPVV